MISVNGQLTGVSGVHAAVLLAKLLKSISATFAAEDWGGLRTSHFHLLSLVPPGGIRITDLGDRLGMTKQASGQFARHLVSTGHVTVSVDPSDRRSRVVARTALGDRTDAAVTARILAIEREWAASVGADRYAVFRSVLQELVPPPDIPN